MCGQVNNKASMQNTVQELTQICSQNRRSFTSLRNEKEQEELTLKHIKQFATSGVCIGDFRKGFVVSNLIAMSSNAENSKIDAIGNDQNNDSLRETSIHTNQKRKRTNLAEEEKQECLRLLQLEEELNKELANLKVEEQQYKRETMDLLHEYNDIKDATQVILGVLATENNVTLASIHSDYGLPLGDD